jgi:hypothetical protein
MVYLFKKKETSTDALKNLFLLDIIEYETDKDIKAFLFNNICHSYIILNKGGKAIFKLYREDYKKHCIIGLDKIFQEAYDSDFRIDEINEHMKLSDHKKCLE